MKDEKAEVIDLVRYRRSKEEMQEFDEFLQSIMVLKNRDTSDMPECAIELIIDHGVHSGTEQFFWDY